MKKILILVVLAALLLSACQGGNINSASVKNVPSALYTEAEISDAVSVVLSEFAHSWKGCTLREIGYAGDEKTAAETEYYLQKNYADFSKSWGKFDQLIVLTSTFDVDESGADGSLASNSTQTNYNWILIRSSGGKWRHVDHGYG